MEKNNQNLLQKLTQILNVDKIISPEDIQAIRDALIGVLANNKKELENLTDETKQAVNSILDKVLIEHDTYLEKTKQIAQEAKSETIEAINSTLKSLEEVKALCKEVMECKPENGEDADEEYVIGEVLNRIKLPEYKEIVLDDGGAIVDKINSLPVNEENQIDAKHIKNLPEGKGGRVISGGVTRKIVEQMIAASGGGGTPGGSTTQLQYNNAGAFGGISGATTNGTAVTFATDGLLANTLKSATSAGTLFESNSGTDVLLLGAGGGAGATFYGGVNIDGSLTVDTDTLYVDATNNRVGVGTTSPSASLHIGGNSATTNSGIHLLLVGKNPKIKWEESDQAANSRVWDVLVDAGQWNLRAVNDADSSATYPFAVTRAGLIGFGTAAPTHTLTLPSTSTGIALYNTADQTTNYERLLASWSSNIFIANVVSAGSGTNRAFYLRNTATSGGTADIRIERAASAHITTTSGISSTGETNLRVAPTVTGTSTIPTAMVIAPAVSQSSTAGYTALLVNPTETTTGSGTKLLADFQVGGSSKAKIDNTGLITAPQVINTPATITVTSNAGTVTRANKINNFTNSSAATMTITMSTTSAADGDSVIVRIKDFSAAAQTITFVNTENSIVTAPTTSNGSTTLPLTVGFIYNSATSKWRCIASA